MSLSEESVEELFGKKVYLFSCRCRYFIDISTDMGSFLHFIYFFFAA